MGKFYSEAHINVALLCIKDGDFKKHLSNQLTKKGPDDSGTCNVSFFDSLSDCKKAIEAEKITSICIEIDEGRIEELLSFIAYTRVATPLIPFCLIGSKQFLDELPNVPEGWKKKLSHYYKLENDIALKDNWNENIHVVRDLFVADFVKCRVLNNYETTPGAIIRVTTPKPYGFYRAIFLAAIISSVLSTIGFYSGRYYYETKLSPQSSIATHQDTPPTVTSTLPKE